MEASARRIKPTSETERPPLVRRTTFENNSRRRVKRTTADMALHFLAEHAFDDLLAVWRRHSDLQHQRSTPIATLGLSRQALDNARQRMHRLRTALYPTVDERDGIVVTALCPVLDEVVHLCWNHRDDRRPGNVRCLCGELVPIP